MRTITTTIELYQFEELSEVAQQRAIEGIRDINTDLEWWEYVYEDAKNVGLEISEFDLGRANSIKITFQHSADYTARLIMEEHGPDCATYAAANKYSDERNEILAHPELYYLHEGPEDNPYISQDEALEDLETSFLGTLGDEYLAMLQREYDYLTSDKAVKESIIANAYEFHASGKLYAPITL